MGNQIPPTTTQTTRISSRNHQLGGQTTRTTSGTDSSFQHRDRTQPATTTNYHQLGGKLPFAAGRQYTGEAWIPEKRMKLLSNRLRKVIPNLVGYEQSAFIKGCNILDGALIANETVDYLKHKKSKRLVFKVDFKKAFDSLSWEFLMEIMGIMGFGIKWRDWILSCLKSASISILVNGSSTNEFKLERGVRQGNPLSPFLFILAAEGLNVLTKLAVKNNLYQGVLIGKDKVPISHLQYADDTIFFGSWIESNSETMSAKEGVVLKYGDGDDGDGVVPLEMVVPPDDGDRVMLMDVYSMWGMIEREVGWFKIEPTSLWVKVVKSLYGFNGGLNDTNLASVGTYTSVWSNIVNTCHLIASLGIPFQSYYAKEIGDGANTSFWSDVWLGNELLKNKFKQLVVLENDAAASVKDRVTWNVSKNIGI
ncbi:uncharacterized protein [Rutidosis leptorrhynchoides]|uniref:uncharacterized protein n=1 Tax=Rutidosis leptorrhynchoides TaxID=125765 RepID=UPI003A9954B8